MLVYLASAYTNGDLGQNIRDVVDVADKVLDLKHTPYIPHLNLLWDIISPKSWETWMEIDLKILDRCDCLLRLPGESVGADREVEHAKQEGIPVLHSIRELNEVESIKL